MVAVVVFADALDGASHVRWQPLQLHTKAALPIEDYVVVTGQCRTDAARQVTCIGGHVKSSSSRLLLVLPLSVASSTPSSNPSIQVVEVGECAVQFLTDMKACFPSLVRKNPLAYDDSDDDSDDDSTASESGTRRKSSKEKSSASVDSSAASVSDTTAAFLAKTRVRVIPSMAALCEAYPLGENSDFQSTFQSDVELEYGSACVQFLCIELPANAPVATAQSDQKEPHFGVLFVHDRDTKSKCLQIPLLRQLRGYFYQDEDQEEEVIHQDATVFTFNTKRESSEFGGGKTAEETVQNIRQRHASGTFCTLVYPTKQWDDLRRKYTATVPQVDELYGEIRARRFVGVIPNRPIAILLEQSL